MKRNKFIEKVLKHPDNTVFVNEDQVDAVLNLFQKLGMKPPTLDEDRCQMLVSFFYFI